jgi:hypothetical protein
VADEPVPQRLQLVLAEERHHAIGHDHRRPAAGDGVQPVRVPHVRADHVGVRTLRDQALPRGGDRGEVDVVPVGGGRRRDAGHPGVQPGTQVQPDPIRVAGQEVRGHLVQLPGPEGDVEDEVGVDVELAEVVVDLVDDLVGHGVAEDGVGPAVVERPGVQRQEQAVLQRREGRKRDSHWFGPSRSSSISRVVSLATGQVGRVHRRVETRGGSCG